MKLRWATVCVGFLALTSRGEAQWLYFTDNNGSDSGIARWNLGVPGSQPEFLVTAHQLDLMGYGIPGGSIAIDSVGGKIYFWANPAASGSGTIFRANLDGTVLEPIHDAPGNINVFAAAIYRPPGNVPAVSAWGLLVLAATVASAGTVIATRKNRRKVA